MAAEETPNLPENAPGAMSREERMWGMFCHLAGLAMFVIPSLGQVIGPLIIWLVKKDEFPFVDSQGKEALNFQISMTIYSFVALALVITIPLILAIAVFDVIEIILASVSANEGKPWKYPLTIRFIK